MNAMVFLTSSSFRSILLGPSSVCLSLIFVFYYFYLRCLGSATIWYIFVHIFLTSEFCVYSNSVENQSVPFSEPLKLPYSRYYEQLCFPRLIGAHQHSNNSSLKLNFDDLNGSNRKEIWSGLPNTLSKYQSITTQCCHVHIPKGFEADSFS